MDLGALISTTITATAALVAILGGFLVSRVITLAGEKNAIDRRLREINNELNAKKEILENLKSVLFEEKVDDFIEPHAEDLFYNKEVSLIISVISMMDIISCKIVGCKTPNNSLPCLWLNSL